MVQVANSSPRLGSGPVRRTRRTDGPPKIWRSSNPPARSGVTPAQRLSPLVVVRFGVSASGRQ